VLSLASGLGFGLVPALRLAGDAITGGVRQGGRAVVGGPALRRIRSALVLGEVALAFVLLVGAGLLIRSFDGLLRVDPGFRADGLVAGRVLLPRTSYGEDAKQVAFLQQAVDRLAALPAVGSAAVVSNAPLGDSPPYVAFDVQGRPERNPGVVQDVELLSASPSYFGTLGIPLLQGRLFDDTDRAGSSAVALVNQAAVRRYFGGRSPLGSSITFDNPTDSAAHWMTVVGVVGDIHHASLSEPPYPQAYLPVAQSPGRWMVLVARARGRDPLALAPALREVVARLDPTLALSGVATMEQRIASTTARPRVSALLLGSFAATALLLAAIGIYGVVSHGVVQRTRELGIRMALGARAQDVLRLVLRQGLAPVLAGLVLGLVAAAAASRVLRGLLYGVDGTDPATYATVMVFLAAVALAATWLPARRAARADPVEALRNE
jgi:putative ABC transport system permease protein